MTQDVVAAAVAVSVLNAAHQNSAIVTTDTVNTAYMISPGSFAGEVVTTLQLSLPAPYTLTAEAPSSATLQYVASESEEASVDMTSFAVSVSDATTALACDAASSTERCLRTYDVTLAFASEEAYEVCEPFQEKGTEKVWKDSKSRRDCKKQRTTV